MPLFFSERNKLTDRDIFSRKKLARYLQYYFQDHHPDNAKNISVQCFGSTINGFGFRGSDLDMFVEGISANMTLVRDLEEPLFTLSF